MNLDRGLIKQQAKALMKGKVMKLFVTAFVISICVSLIASVGAVISASISSYSIINDTEKYVEDYDYFNDFNEDAFDAADEFNSFTGEIKPVEYGDYVIGEETNQNAALSAIASFFTTLGSIAAFLLAPLSVTLLAYYVEFIRGKERDLDDGIKSVFKNTFNNSYGKKLGVYVLKNIFTYLLTLLFVIPGIIFGYSSRYAYQIMCDNPNIGPMQAIKLSKKIVQGNRTELFMLDLSFLPWAFLCVFLFPAIYVIPYYYTTDALYYENFRLRALQQGRVTEDDFLTDEEKMMKYAQQGYTQNTNNNQYYNPNVNVGSQAAYYNPSAENNATQSANNAGNVEFTQSANNAGNVEFTQTSYNQNDVQYAQPSNETSQPQQTVNEVENPVSYQPPVEETETKSSNDSTIIIDGVSVDNTKDTTDEL